VDLHLSDIKNRILPVMLWMKCRMLISVGDELLCVKHRIENQSTILIIDIMTEEVEEVVDMTTDAEVAAGGMMIDAEGALHQDDEEAPHLGATVVVATRTEDVAVADHRHDDDPDLDQATAIDARLF